MVTEFKETMLTLHKEFTALAKYELYIYNIEIQIQLFKRKLCRV
jgi:hypothetical protein